MASDREVNQIFPVDKAKRSWEQHDQIFIQVICDIDFNIDFVKEFAKL